MNDKLIVYVAASTIAVGVAARNVIKVTKEERQKRKDIRRNMHLDIEAIHNAAPVITQMIERGDIRSLESLAQHLNDEIEFQKIIIREQS